MRRPDGSAEHVRVAAVWESWILILIAVGLGIFFETAVPLLVGAAFAARAAWQATEPLAGAPLRPSWRLLARGLIPWTSLGSLLLFARFFSPGTLPPAGDLGALAGIEGLWLAFVVAFWGHLATLTRPGSAIRRAVHLRGAAIATLAAGLLGIALYGAWGLRGNVDMDKDFFQLLTGGLVGALATSLLAPALLRQMMAPFRAPPQLEARYVEGLVEALERTPGWRVGRVPAGVRAEREAPEAAIRLEIDLQRTPARAEIVADLRADHPFAAAIAIRARKRGEEGGVDLEDPLLRGALLVEGVAPEEARALLGGLHAPLLAIFHAYPGATLREGRLALSLEGPPFAAGQSAAEAAAFLAARAADFAALAGAVRYPPGVAEAETARARRTPTPTREG